MSVSPEESSLYLIHTRTLARWHCLMLSLALFTRSLVPFLERDSDRFPCIQSEQSKRSTQSLCHCHFKPPLPHSWNWSSHIIPLIYHQWGLLVVTHVTKRERTNLAFCTGHVSHFLIKKPPHWFIFLFTLHPTLTILSCRFCRLAGR